MIPKQILQISLLLNCISFSRPHSFGTYSSPNFNQIFKVLPQECIIWFMMDQTEPPKQFVHADQPIVNENSMHVKYIKKTANQIRNLFFYRNAKCLLFFLYISDYTSKNDSSFLSVHYAIPETYKTKLHFQGFESVSTIRRETNNYQNIFYVSLSPFKLHGDYYYIFEKAIMGLYPKDRILFLVLVNRSPALACVLQIKSDSCVIAVCNPLNQTSRYNLDSFESVFFISSVIRIEDKSDAPAQKSHQEKPRISFIDQVSVNAASFIVFSVASHLNMSYSVVMETYPYVIIGAGSYWRMEWFVLLRSEPVIFITCYTFDPYVSFKLYWSAFDYKIWLSILITFLVLSCALYLFLHYKKIVGDFSPWLFYFRFLVDEPVDYKQQLVNNCTFNILTFPWIALSVIFTCLYTSSLVTDLNLPVSGEKLKDHEQTYCPESIRDNLIYDQIDEFPAKFYKKEALKLRLQKYNKTDDEFYGLQFYESVVTKYARRAGIPLQQFIEKFKLDKYNKTITENGDFAAWGRTLSYYARTEQLPLQEFLNKVGSRRSWAFPLTELDLELYFKQFQNRTNCYTFLSRPVGRYQYIYIPDPSAYFFMQQLARRPMEDLRAKSKRNRYAPKLEKIPQIKKFANQTNSLDRGLIIEAAIEDELIECGKTVYVAERSLALKELEYLNLNYKNKFYAVLNRSIFFIQSGIEYENLIGKQFHQSLVGFVESGIYKNIAEGKEKHKYNRRRLATIKLLGGSTQPSVDKVRINNSIQTIFYLSMILVFIGTIVFVFEIQSLNLRNIFGGDPITIINLYAIVKNIISGFVEILLVENQKVAKTFLKIKTQGIKNVPKGIIKVHSSLDL